MRKKGSLFARGVCEREAVWQALEKGSSGAREVCERSNLAGARERELGCQRGV